MHAHSAHINTARAYTCARRLCGCSYSCSCLRRGKYTSRWISELFFFLAVRYFLVALLFCFVIARTRAPLAEYTIAVIA